MPSRAAKPAKSIASIASCHIDLCMAPPRLGQINICPICASEFWTPPSHIGQICCSHKCGGEMKRIRYRGFAKARYDTKPYIRIFRNGKKHLEHKLILEQKLGRTLREDECTHHINGDKKDNRPENLSVMLKSNHSRMHNISCSSRPRDWLGRWVHG